MVDRATPRATKVIPIMRQIRRSGAKSLRQIAEALNARGISAPRGGEWHATSVRNATTASRKARSKVNGAFLLYRSITNR
jgi:hypothetical protein